jgi:hypothetical protein
VDGPEDVVDLVVLLDGLLQNFIQAADVLLTHGHVGAQHESGLGVHGGQVGRNERHEHPAALVGRHGVDGLKDQRPALRVVREPVVDGDQVVGLAGEHVQGGLFIGRRFNPVPQGLQGL